jgi:hypothetical protein
MDGTQAAGRIPVLDRVRIFVEPQTFDNPAGDRLAPDTPVAGRYFGVRVENGLPKLGERSLPGNPIQLRRRAPRMMALRATGGPEQGGARDPLVL